MAFSPNAGIGALQALLGGMSGAAQQQQLAQMQNAYAAAMGNYSIRGEKLKANDVEYDVVTDRVRKKHEFAWLRERVLEVLWNPQA